MKKELSKIQIFKDFATKIEEIFAQKSLPQKFAVAVSGGCDSLALTLLLDEFCCEKKIELFALTVNHQMRTSSSFEVQELGKILAAKKIRHHIFTIPQEKIPSKNIEAKLRDLRFELLNQFCLQNEIQFLFLGHHQGDVAENFLIRLFRGSGLDGLSTMSFLSNFLNVKLVRPLLDFQKNELKEFLLDQKIEWFEDESNEDEKFLRNKIRKFLNSFPQENLITQRIKKASDEIALARDLFDKEMLVQAKQILALQSDGSFLLRHKNLSQLDKRIALKILALLLMEVSQKPYKPRLEKLQRFYDYLTAQDKIKPRNFYQCTTKKFDEERVVIFCEKKDLKNEAKNQQKIWRTILKKIF